MLYWLLKEQMGKPIKFSEPRQWIIFNQVSVIFSGHMALWKFDNNVARKADIICRRNWQAKSFLSLQGPRLKCTKDKMLVCKVNIYIDLLAITLNLQLTSGFWTKQSDKLWTEIDMFQWDTKRKLHKMLFGIKPHSDWWKGHINILVL